MSGSILQSGFGERGQETSYSSWLADTVYQYALVSGEEALAVDFLPELVSCLRIGGSFQSDKIRSVLVL